MENRKHHVIPASLPFGIDYPCNIVVVSKEEHDLIHKFLNLPYESIRKFRLATNHVLFSDYSYIQRVHSIHKEYFSNLKQLPKDLQKLHAEAMCRIVTWAVDTYNVPLPPSPAGANTFVELFNDTLNMFHNVLHIAVREKKKSLDLVKELNQL